MLSRFLSSCGYIVLIYIQAFFFCGLFVGWLRLPGGDYGMSALLLLLLGAVVLGLYLLYAMLCYFLSHAVIPTGRLIRCVFIVSTVFVMLASVSDPLDVINFVFIASLFVGSVVAWLLHRAMSPSK